RLQAVAVGRRDLPRRDLRHGGDDVLDVARADRLLLPAGGLAPRRRAGLVDHVDGFVGQEPVVHVLGGEVGGRAQCAVRIRYAVVALVVGPEPAQDGVRLVHRRLTDLDPLEPAGGRAGAPPAGPVGLVRRRTPPAGAGPG